MNDNRRDPCRDCEQMVQLPPENAELHRVAAAPRFPGSIERQHRRSRSAEGPANTATERQLKSIDRGTRPGIATRPTIEIHRRRNTAGIAARPTIEIHRPRNTAGIAARPTIEVHRPRNTARHRDGTDNRNPSTEEHGHASRKDRQSKSIGRGTGQSMSTGRRS